MRAVSIGLAGLAAGVLGVPCAARAHVGASVAKATFSHPAPAAMTLITDGGLSGYDFSGYVPEAADASYTIAWTDGDVDPTGKFTFYYSDHALPIGVSAAQVEQNFTIVVDAQGREARDVYVACFCDVDAGVKCPDLDGGMRRCDNQVAWDTRAVPDGAYWIAAVNHDPPFYVYNLAEAPVRVHHPAAAAQPPPVVVIARPDGLGTASDAAYRTQFAIVGKPPFLATLAYGSNDENRVLGPVTILARKVPVTRGADGTATWDWDVTTLPSGQYFLSVAIVDGTGVSTFTDSRWPLAIFHAPDQGSDDAAPGVDLAAPGPPPGTCACAIGRGAARSRRGLPWLLLLPLGWRGLRRRPAAT